MDLELNFDQKRSKIDDETKKRTPKTNFEETHQSAIITSLNKARSRTGVRARADERRSKFLRSPDCIQT